MVRGGCPGWQLQEMLFSWGLMMFIEEEIRSNCISCWQNGEKVQKKTKICSRPSETNINVPAILDEDEDVDPDLKSLRVF